MDRLVLLQLVMSCELRSHEKASTGGGGGMGEWESMVMVENMATRVTCRLTS